MKNPSALNISENSPILITGSSGFIGRNLVANLRALGYSNLLEFDTHCDDIALADFSARAAFVFHLAGINRPKKTEDFYTGNTSLTEKLIAFLQKNKNQAPLLLSSSAQAGNGTDYAKSKEEAEAAVFAHALQNSSPAYVYRLDGVFGKWSRPSYNSVVATFCHNIARNIPIEVRDPAFELPLCYIDDVVASFMHVMIEQPLPLATNEYMKIQPVYTTTLGSLASTLQQFKESRTSLRIANMGNSFEEKLYATYLSFLPETDFSYPLTMHQDERGSFTEFMRTEERGQVSVNISKPGIVKGEHWHNTKNEKFLVVRGSAIIRFRKIGETEIIEYPVSEQELIVVDIPTGYTHNIENTGHEDLVTVMWASEPFDPSRPDTYFEKV